MNNTATENSNTTRWSMPRWSMLADLRRCVGCQTCTAACKHVNATAPTVQWRKVLDFEVGEYPEVRRAFVPVGCMHCEDPPCMHVCPSTATGQRADGIVTIDYDLCIGCAYCAVACPYQARYKVDKPVPAYGRDGRLKNEVQREDPARLGVAQKCTFCSDRVDTGLDKGLVPGIDPEATPACVNSCIADALHFGDSNDPDSNISRLLAENRSFRMHEEVGTGSGFHYIYQGRQNQDDQISPDADPWPAAVALSTGNGAVGGIAPWRQRHWDWRAAGNFMFGGSGSGLILATSMMSITGGILPPPALPDLTLPGLTLPGLTLLGLALVAVGLLFVWLETGRPWRAPLNVLFHPQTSWMSREAMAALSLFPLGIFAVWQDGVAGISLAAAAAFAFLYCQAQILKAARGIPAWREPAIVPLIISTGLAEGCGLALLAVSLLDTGSVTTDRLLAQLVLLTLLVIRSWNWNAYRRVLAMDAPTGTQQELQKTNLPLLVGGHIVPLGLLVSNLIWLDTPAVAVPLAAGLAVLSGWLLKYILIVRASYNQGFAIVHTPERGTGGPGPGARPGWNGS